MHAGDHQAPDVTGLQARRFQGSGQGILAKGQVAVLAEALFPQPRGTVARRAPTIGELVRGRGGGDQLCEDAGPLADEHGSAGVAAGGLVRAGGQAVAQVPGDDQGRSGSPRSAAIRQPIPERSAPPKS